MGPCQRVSDCRPETESKLSSGHIPYPLFVFIYLTPPLCLTQFQYLLSLQTAGRRCTPVPGCTRSIGPSRDASGRFASTGCLSAQTLGEGGALRLRIEIAIGNINTLRGVIAFISLFLSNQREKYPSIIPPLGKMGNMPITGGCLICKATTTSS